MEPLTTACGGRNCVVHLLCHCLYIRLRTWKQVAVLAVKTLTRIQCVEQLIAIADGKDNL